MAMTPDGCSACGGTYFYISNHRCVACVSEVGRIKSEAKAATSLRGRNGLRHGFLLFDTVAHKILLYLDKNGPAGHAELLKGTGTIVATDIRKLVLAGFIEVIGEARETGGRPYSVFDIVGRSEKMPPLKRQTKAQMIANYRKRRRARVASVFEFRGKISINERKAA